MLIRHARESDADALAAYGQHPGHDPWIAEVVEIVHGLWAWRDSALAADHDRQVLVLEDDGEVVAVCAHEATDNGKRVFVEHRYLMVTAVWPDHQRSGLARLLVTSVIADQQQAGARSVTWLVHPHNHPSIAFSRQVFPEADETYPPEDAPYVAFTLTLD